MNWFTENHMKANADECHLLVSSGESRTAKIDDFNIDRTKEKLLEVQFYFNLTFKNYVNTLCKRQSRSYTLLPEYHILWTCVNAET